MNYALYVRFEKNLVDITSTVKRIDWYGDLETYARTVEFTAHNSTGPSKKLYKYSSGQQVVLYVNKKEVFRGVLFQYGIDKKGVVSVTAYDEAIYLTKNEDTKVVSNQTASTFLKRLYSEYGVAVGNIANTGYVHKKKIFRERTLSDMTTALLTDVRKHTGKRFTVYSSKGKVNLIPLGANAAIKLSDDLNILDADYNISMEDMKTQVKIIAGDDKKTTSVYTAKDTNLNKKYGIMQHTKRVDEKMKAGQVRQLAQSLLKELAQFQDEANVESIGFASCISGRGIEVKERMTGIVGKYYIASDKHTFEGNKHTMRLSVSKTLELPEAEGDE